MPIEEWINETEDETKSIIIDLFIRTGSYFRIRGVRVYNSIQEFMISERGDEKSILQLVN